MDVLILEVIKQALSLSNHGQQAALRMLILNMLLEMTRETFYAAGK